MPCIRRSPLLRSQCCCTRRKARWQARTKGLLQEGRQKVLQERRQKVLQEGRQEILQEGLHERLQKGMQRREGLLRRTRLWRQKELRQEIILYIFLLYLWVLPNIVWVLPNIGRFSLDRKSPFCVPNCLIQHFSSPYLRKKRRNYGVNLCVHLRINEDYSYNYPPNRRYSPFVLPWYSDKMSLFTEKFLFWQELCSPLRHESGFPLLEC